jgi:4-amino-4-deoxy-L-arabinose transferase-like glycosyltransferase
MEASLQIARHAKRQFALADWCAAVLPVAAALGLYAWNLWGAPAFGSLADQPYHLQLGQEFHRAWQDGDSLPRWAAGANGGRGSIGFVLYPPFFAFLTACWLQLGVPATEALRLAVVTAAAGTFAAVFYLARAWLSWRRSLVAAALVLLLPGVTFVGLGRGMLPHFTALGWVALLLGAGQRTLLGRQVWRNAGLAAGAAAGLAVTHPLTAYLLALTLLVVSPLLVRALGGKGTLAAVAVALVAAILSCWYWLPLIHAGTYAGVGYLDDSHPYLNSVLGGSSQSGEQAAGGVFQQDWVFLNEIGRYIVIAQSLLAALVVFALRRKPAPPELRRDGAKTPPGKVLFLQALPFVAGFAFLAATEPGARLLLELPNFTWVQFSWRWQSLVALWCGVGLAALPWEKRSAPAAILAGMTLLFFSPLIIASDVQPLEESHVLPSALTSVQFRDLSAIEQSAYAGSNMLGLRPSRIDQRYYLAADFGKAQIIAGEAQIEPLVLKTSHRAYTISAASPATVRLETYHVQGWSAQLDHQEIEIQQDAETGLQLVSVPPGTHRLDLSYNAPWPRWATLRR